MKYALVILAALLFSACSGNDPSDAKTLRENAKKEQQINVYQAQIERTKARLDSFRVEDEKTREDLKKLDMAR
jgi:hypothetical protein